MSRPKSPLESLQKGDAETDICLERRGGGDAGEVVVNEGKGQVGGKCNRKTIIIIVIILLLLIIAVIVILAVLLKRKTCLFCTLLLPTERLQCRDVGIASSEIY